MRHFSDLSIHSEDSCISIIIMSSSLTLRGPIILQFALFEVFQVSYYLASQADLPQDLEPPGSVLPAAGLKNYAVMPGFFSMRTI